MSMTFIRTIRESKGILNGMSRTPAIHGDLHLEDDIFEAIKQLVAWKPPPKWKRDRSRYILRNVRSVPKLNHICRKQTTRIFLDM